MASRKDFIKRAKSQAAKYCAFAERSPSQVQDKLLRYGLREREIDPVMEDLINEGFVDVNRFTCAFVHDKFEFNKWGSNRIRHELKLKHGIPPEIIETGLGKIDPEKYSERISELILRKLDAINIPDKSKVRQKLINYMISKGYELALVYPVVDDALSAKEH